MEIPELEFELGMGALGGKFTTLEGLLKDIQALVSDRSAATAAGGEGGRVAGLELLLGGKETVPA